MPSPHGSTAGSKYQSPLGLWKWLGGRDSNPDNMLQRHASYRWTTSQSGIPRRAETPIIYNLGMPKRAAQAGALDATFSALRSVLARHAPKLLVTVDKPGDYQVCSQTLKDRIGRPLFVAAVQTRKNYVSYHLMPVCAPQMLKKVSPALKRRMQGKSCFNFTSVDADLAAELDQLTKAGIEGFEKIKLPWSG